MKTIKEAFKELFPSDMRKYNKYGSQHGKRLTEPIMFLVTLKMKKGINIIIESGKFPNKSEFLRHLIVNYFDEVSKDE